MPHVYLKNIDLPLLLKQQNALVTLIDDCRSLFKPEMIDSLEGIYNLLAAIQDQIDPPTTKATIRKCERCPRPNDRPAPLKICSACWDDFFNAQMNGKI